MVPPPISACETGLAYQVAYMGDNNAAAEHPMVGPVEQQLRESLIAPI
jgi:hypothetical protein